ncbi:NAD-dependent epimerase/dehydratase family protein [Fulvivirga kasyanovii]|uniref:NAD-dependent epimerase/dehydratase family protein n=1 Tax=Fulvivirga kasyanovii TaxID=396812 RepID=A0ABW9RVP9_9BACT|nr:SDR family oxidoreductase [Fulvivirga kasyanovii]MTI27075.1 NAD-dependent epimerase/dehydratase family protein [Fulvivirga kasyanovii]
MKILITGGAGYIGTELVSVLTQRDDVEEIIVYDNLSRANYNLFLGHTFNNHKRVTFVKGELLDSRHLKKVLKGVDVVYHLAAKVTTPFANTDPHFYEQVNHWGTAELVYAVEESDVKKFIFTSSTGVYGSSKSSVEEETVPNPKTFYGISKMRGEEHVGRLSDKVDAYIFRCGNVYGYNRSMRFDAVINKFVFEANFYKRITIHGDGRQHRSFIHIEHVAQALSHVLDGPLQPGVYNLVNRDLQVLDIVDTLKQMIPELEFIFVNQHLKLRELRVQPNQVLNKALSMPEPLSLMEELKHFQSRFSF